LSEIWQKLFRKKFLVRRKFGKDTMKTEKLKDTDRFVSRRELAGRWGCTTRTISRMEMRGELPSTILCGRLFRYKLKEIERIEQERRGGRENSARRKEVPGA
jgi:predicted DNA-binding transcriptional regulator AlpA